MTNYNWLHTQRCQYFTFSNIDSFQHLNFFEDNTFEYQIKGEQNFDKHKQTFELKDLQSHQFININGTWSISYNNQNSEATEIILNFSDEQDHVHKAYNVGTARFLYMSCHSLRCVNSNSVRFRAGHELIK